MPHLSRFPKGGIPLRNSLQVIAYAASTRQQERLAADVQDAVERIEWALREVLSGQRENVQELTFNQPSHDKGQGAILPVRGAESPISDRAVGMTLESRSVEGSDDFEAWKTLLRKDCDGQNKLVVFNAMGDSVLRFLWENGHQPAVNAIGAASDDNSSQM